MMSVLLILFFFPIFSFFLINSCSYFHSWKRSVKERTLKWIIICFSVSYNYPQLYSCFLLQYSHHIAKWRWVLYNAAYVKRSEFTCTSPWQQQLLSIIVVFLLNKPWSFPKLNQVLLFYLRQVVTILNSDNDYNNDYEH